MTKTSLLIGLLLVAFPLSTWKNVIGAAFCPRYLAQNCFAQKPQQAKVDRESCHREMSDMNMSDVQIDGDPATKLEGICVRENTLLAIAGESSAEQVALDRFPELCGYCRMHSQTSSGPGTLVLVDPLQRWVEALAPPVEAMIALRFTNPAAIEPFEHSPPGYAFRRHIVINVFRIQFPG